MPLPLPGGGPTVTVEALLKQPRMIARGLTDLTAKRFVADQVFQRGTPDQVQGGAALYQRSESIFPTNAAREVNPGAGYPRTGWAENFFAAMVKKYGLEVPITDEAKRRNALDMVARGQRKLANALVQFVDTLAMNLLTTDPGVQTTTTSGLWSNTATDKVADIAGARKKVYDVQEGYEPDTLIVNPAQELQLVTDKNIRDALPREEGAGATRSAVITGRPVPILGLQQILVTPQLAAGTVLVGESKMVGTIADEMPTADENYFTFQPGPGAEGNTPYSPIYIKTYREDNRDRLIVRGARFPAMWLAEPASFVVMTGA